LRLSIKERYSVRELERQINASYFERTMLTNASIHQQNSSLSNLQQGIETFFKERYVFEFLNLPEPYSENDLQKGLIQKLKSFLLELGKDFLFMGEEYRLQVGNKDFFIDLLFYHRQLQCLVAFELKTVDFSPEHMGQLNFYLEALDRDVKNAHENPSIGILLCKGKDNEVVEYALSRNLSPALVSEYQMALPDKKLLQDKLHELVELWENQKREEEV
jgi:predicted nuclease of restriction endonuclease-like (RecB) superfamily